MSALVWDEIGSRRFESGCDRGVLYVPNAGAIAWNGLTSVDESFSDVTVEEIYLDGIKYLNRRTSGDYSGTLKALTYPDEFLQFDGMFQVESGIYATAQPVSSTFGLSYRTRVGTDADQNAGYKIHLLYNLTATPDDRSFGTLSDKSSGEEFSWKLSGIPISVPGMKPTAHVIIDSTKFTSEFMTAFENLLYGTSTSVGSLPSVADLMQVQPFNSIDGSITEPLTEPL